VPSSVTPVEPYTANRKSTRVQKLKDGTTITHETISKEARDSSGRTYHESRQETPAGAEGQIREFSFFTVFDPVNRININWNSQSKEATVFHMPDPSQVRQNHLQAQETRAQVNQPAPADRPTRPVREDLGTKTINGVDAKGTRITTIIPAGRAGNDQPLTITREIWMSPELGIGVLQINDDPRTGVQTMELTDIERGEPDPSLFQVPEGYTVKDQYQGQQN
jgi:hypothetical protein